MFDCSICICNLFFPKELMKEKTVLVKYDFVLPAWPDTTFDLSLLIATVVDFSAARS